MLQTIKTNIAGALLALALVALAAFIIAPAPAGALDSNTAIDRKVKCGSNISGLDGACNDNVAGSSTKIEDLIKTIINIFSAIVGSISVIMIIVGGFRYITSAGDSNNVSGAKNTILYAIVGLIIVAFAQIIVQFVLQRGTPA